MVAKASASCVVRLCHSTIWSKTMIATVIRMISLYIVLVPSLAWSAAVVGCLGLERKVRIQVALTRLGLERFTTSLPMNSTLHASDFRGRACKCRAPVYRFNAMDGYVLQKRLYVVWHDSPDIGCPGRQSTDENSSS